MRAKSVNEEVHFERGQDPKSNIGLGIIGQFEKGMRSLENLPHRARIRLVNVSNLAHEYYVSREIKDNKIDIEDLGIIFPCQFNENHINVSDLERVILDENDFGSLASMFYDQLPAYRIKTIFFNNYYLIPIKKEYRIYLESLVDKNYNKISESLKFEKGQDPRHSMGIGVHDQEMMKEGIDAFTHWLYYIDAEDMIKKAFDGWDHIRNKLREKAEASGYLDPNALMKFVRDLDVSNQGKLYDYIIENHSDKW